MIFPLVFRTYLGFSINWIKVTWLNFLRFKFNTVLTMLDSVSANIRFLLKKMGSFLSLSVTIFLRIIFFSFMDTCSVP